MDENILEELQDLKRLRNSEIKEIQKYREYLSMFKPETKTSRILAWVLPIAMFLGFGFGTYFFMQALMLPCGGN